VLLVVGVCPAAVVTFTPDLDADTQPNNSALNPYDSFTNQTDASAGIPDDVIAIFSDTYFFEDFDTGIEFSFDVQWTATGGNLNGNTTTLGVGDNDIEGAESILIEVSSLNVDFVNYVSGSVAGITTPTLDNATVTFETISFADRTSNAADESIIDIVGSSATTWGTAAGGVGDNRFVFGADGLTTSETSILISQNAGSTVDTDFSLASTQFNVTVEFSESATAVPEPSTVMCLVLTCGLMVGRRRRR